MNDVSDIWIIMTQVLGQGERAIKCIRTKMNLCLVYYEISR